MTKTGMPRFTITNHSELYPEVLNSVSKNASNEMSAYPHDKIRKHAIRYIEFFDITKFFNNSAYLLVSFSDWLVTVQLFCYSIKSWVITGQSTQRVNYRDLHGRVHRKKNCFLHWHLEEMQVFCSIRNSLMHL